MIRFPTHPTRGAIRLRPLFGFIACTALVLSGAGCNLNFLEGQALENEKRWEEAAIAYHLALVDDPDDSEYQEAVIRTNKVVARENFAIYRELVAKKAFHKAYNRLVDASRQDPGYKAVHREAAKWDRILVGGQVLFKFDIAQTGLSLADEIRLIVRINTPNPGKTIDAEVDIDTGFFFAEDILYDRPAEFLAYYSIHSIGASMLFGRTRIKKFISREYRQFVRFQTPIMDEISGTLPLPGKGSVRSIREHRKTLSLDSWPAKGIIPSINPHYSIRFLGTRILVTSTLERTLFTPRFIYLNKPDRRIFVDFGKYESRFQPLGRKWTLRRVSLAKRDYFGQFSRNIALAPYFFYRGRVFTFEKAGGRPSG